MLRLRHFLFDVWLIPSKAGAIKTLVVGNLELGGTGKSQLVMLLIELLNNDKQLAVLSRGYGRMSSGFVQVEIDSDSSQVGDEPLMFKRRFPKMVVAVCEDRLSGIERVNQLHPEVDLLILDDAFQHRKLKPDFSILTSSFSEPYFKNALIPAGTLRDIRLRAKSADVLVVTDSPNSSAQERNWEGSGLDGDITFFSTSNQAVPIQVGGNDSDCSKKVWLLSGIARPERFYKTAESEFEVLGHSVKPDHHRFTQNDLAGLRRKLDSFEPSEVSVLITEKDAARTGHKLLNTAFHPFRVFYLPLEMKMLRQDELKMKILKHVFGENQEKV